MTCAARSTENRGCRFQIEQPPGRKKKNAIAKVGRHVVTFTTEGGAQRFAAFEPRLVAGDGPSPRGPPGLDQLLTVEETAELLRCSASSLNKWRLLGRGPSFVRVGARVRYRAADLADFIAASTRSNTSQRAAPPPA